MLLFRVLVFYSFLVSSVSYAQSPAEYPPSYVSLSERELALANVAVSQCEILNDLIQNNGGGEDVAAARLFSELQQTNSDGQLLIDNLDCRESILRFVSSVCASSSDQNRAFCAKLGIHGYPASNRDDYKQFGSSAIDALGVGRSLDRYSEPNVMQDTSRFSVAGVLFLLSPVKKLKLASRVRHTISPTIKPVLNGALLVLAALGLSSCDDLNRSTNRVWRR